MKIRPPFSRDKPVSERPDVLTPAQRSFCMSRIRSEDTKPEMIVRRLVHAMGFRYRLHDASLPGKPDLVFRSRRKIIFVHGCFWHRHECALGQATPRTNAEFWAAKLTGNVERDRKVREDLEAAGWSVLVVWECQTRTMNPEQLATLIKEHLS